MAAHNFASRYDDSLSLAYYPLAASGYTIQRKTKSQSLVQKTAMIFTVFMMTEDVRVKCGTFS